MAASRGGPGARRAHAGRSRGDVDLEKRPRPPIETAAYFVVAEALANAGKYAGARSVEIAVQRVEDRTLVGEVRDHGHGGADRGRGSPGLRRRVAAIDGSVASKPDGRPKRPSGAAMRVVLAEDFALFRDGSTRLLRAGLRGGRRDRARR